MTKQRTEPTFAERDRPVEIEITDEMIEAGHEVFRLALPDAEEASTYDHTRTFIVDIYRAMSRERIGRS